MNLTQKFKKKIIDIIEKQKITTTAPSTLAISFCLGLFIAFSPFIGFHTIMAVVFPWLFGLNMPMILLGTIVNNPWTMIPIYSLDYGVGYYIIHSIFKIDSSWVIPLHHLFGCGKICLLSFLVGGNLMAILASFIAYPFILNFFKNYKKTKS
ncbi:MAG: hypothetical protein UR14_C0006G0102 [candidate division TM6 bacterium GW2011_GWE2_31_21]|nr:MAG: hypothetical protein UR14_C0006G0102 [candidate division TM6 bacterium GW2011_GWE2_31_21]KKP53475.1 MAG: hypothetical protein UR43_C0004G0016 [candidate division TM6 bacterium GW2011_GWF2_33_332]